MERSTSNKEEWPIKIAVKAVGLQEIDENNPTVKETNAQKCGCLTTQPTLLLMEA